MTTQQFDYRKLLVSISIISLVLPQVISAHSWMAPKAAGALKNPVQQSESSVQRGLELYQDNCAACHGDSAGGLSAEEAGLAMPTPNLPKRLATHTVGDFFWKIQHGRGDMPAFKGELSDEEIWDVVNFIQSKVSNGDN